MMLSNLYMSITGMSMCPYSSSCPITFTPLYIIKPTETPTKRSALSVAVGGFKQSVTMFARRNGIEFGWQKRFHDRIIRNIGEGKTITEYIKNNISRWDSDCYYGKYSQLT